MSRHHNHSKAEAILKAMTPLGNADTSMTPEMRQRRLLADLCRLIGAHLDGAEGNLPVSVNASFGSAPRPANGELSPRMQQTLESLLAGDREMQAAAKLGVSPTRSLACAAGGSCLRAGSIRRSSENTTRDSATLPLPSTILYSLSSCPTGQPIFARLHSSSRVSVSPRSVGRQLISR